MSFADWRAARRAARGDVEANPGAGHISPGSSSGPEGAYELNDMGQQQQQPVTAGPSSAPTVVGEATPKLPSPVNEAATAGPSSAPTVVEEAAPKLPSPVNEAAQLDAGGIDPVNPSSETDPALAGVLSSYVQGLGMGL